MRMSMPGPLRKSSHTASAGTSSSPFPSLMTRNSFTSSGKATAFGRRTAWERFDLNTVALIGAFMR